MEPKHRQWPGIPDINVPALVDEHLNGAACAGLHPMFDEHIHGETIEARISRHNAARKVCTTCPVRAACADVAAELDPKYRTGVWAGRTYGRTRAHPETTAA